jgi:hypothetical protein
MQNNGAHRTPDGNTAWVPDITLREGQFEKYFEAAAETARCDPALEVAVLGEAVAASSVLSDPRRVLVWAERARGILDDHPAMERIATDTGWAVTACLTGDAAGVPAVLASLADGRLSAAVDESPPMLAVWTAVAANHVAMMIERFDQAYQAFEVGWARAQRVGAPLLIIYMGIGHADVLCRQGRLAEAQDLIASVEEANRGLERGLSAITALPKTLVALETGDTARAAAECNLLDATLLQHFPDYYPIHRIWLWKLQAEMALDAGRINESESVERADAIRKLARHSGLVEPCAVPWADTVMSAYIRSSRFQDVEHLGRDLERVPAEWPCRWPRSVAQTGWAALIEAGQDYQQAEDHHRQAIALLEDVDLPLASVRALVNYGSFLRRAVNQPRHDVPLAVLSSKLRLVVLPVLWAKPSPSCTPAAGVAVEGTDRNCPTRRNAPPSWPPGGPLMPRSPPSSVSHQKRSNIT